MTTLACPRCGWNHWPTDNPVEIDAWRCCAPAQGVSTYADYLDPLTPGGSAPAGEADDALLPGPSLAELTEAARACAWLAGGLLAGLGAVAFVAMWLRDLLRIGGA